MKVFILNTFIVVYIRQEEALTFSFLVAKYYLIVIDATPDKKTIPLVSTVP